MLQNHVIITEYCNLHATKISDLTGVMGSAEEVYLRGNFYLLKAFIFV